MHNPIAALHRLHATERGQHSRHICEEHHVRVQSIDVRNELLASLPDAALARILPQLTPIALESHQGISYPDGPITSVCFPQSGMVSLVVNLDDGMQAEVGLIGREGMVGIPLLSGVDTSYCEAVVQMAGSALCMSAADFRTEAETNAPFRTVLQRYSEALRAHTMQTAACNSHHGLEQRLARWLLMASDRADGADLPLTQDFISMMLGVHRPSVTLAAGSLQRAGMISYASGAITVLDRAALEAASCECYGAVRRRFAALLCTAGR